MFGARIKLFGFFVLSILNFFLTLLHKLLHTRHYSTNKEEHENQQQDIISWSELDPDLLGEIRGRLRLADQLRFQVVCKNWLHAHPITTSKTKPLLWYLSFDRSLFELQIHDPSSSDPACVQNISLTKLGIPSPPCFKNVSSILLEHSWLFILIVKPRLFFGKRKYSLLFSPFTKKAITLPTFDYPCPFKYLVLTSSTQPDSSDCVFFLLDTCNAEKFTILTYRNGDKEWTAKRFNRVSEFKPCYCQPVYLDGILYIVSLYGQVASYNIVDGEFRSERLFIDELMRLNIRSRMQCQVFELNGELMMIHFVLYERKHVTIPGKPCIKRYNWSSKDWIPISTLGDKSIFFSEKNDQVATIKNDEIMRNNGVIPNKIYQFFDGGCLIYSVKEDGELVEFKSVLLEEGGGDLPEYKYKAGSVFSGTTKAIYWLQPPHVSF